MERTRCIFRLFISRYFSLIFGPRSEVQVHIRLLLFDWIYSITRFLNPHIFLFSSINYSIQLNGVEMRTLLRETRHKCFPSPSACAMFFTHLKFYFTIQPDVFTHLKFYHSAGY